ncbi:hypothetical protein [Amycolatopsis pretoriensis]|uniref:hypothetical protein n=1 Tax=Amycolatopsis pretoriensis TaxID=218821 RepID=UPI001B80DC10|nr:hypothetical protein [Amycolatopsis pretoriensis]
MIHSVPRRDAEGLAGVLRQAGVGGFGGAGGQAREVVVHGRFQDRRCGIRVARRIAFGFAAPLRPLLEPLLRRKLPADVEAEVRGAKRLLER